MGKKDKKNRMPSPCIDICKDKHGRCIACGRNDDDKHAWKKAETEQQQLKLIMKCVVFTEEIGTKIMWEREYRKKCKKKGAVYPLDNLPQLTIVGTTST